MGLMEAGRLVQEGLGAGRSRQGGGVSDHGRDVVVWLSGLGGRRWCRWLLAVVQGDAVVVGVQGEVEAQVGDDPTQGHSVAAMVSKGSASLQVLELGAKAGQAWSLKCIERWGLGFREGSPSTCEGRDGVEVDGGSTWCRRRGLTRIRGCEVVEFPWSRGSRTCLALQA